MFSEIITKSLIGYFSKTKIITYLAEICIKYYICITKKVYRQHLKGVNCLSHHSLSETYSDSDTSQISKMELFVKIVDNFQISSQKSSS